MTRIVFIDDNKDFISGLKTLINRCSDMQVIGYADNGKDGYDMVLKFLPDIVIIDCGMPGMNGVELAHKIDTCCPNLKLLALSAYDNTDFITGMNNAHVRGYVLKADGPQSILDAIRAVAEGKKYFSPGIEEKLRHKHDKN